MKVKLKVLKQEKSFNIDEITKMVEKNVVKALEESAILVHSDAVHLAPVAEYLGGNLRSSIGYSVHGQGVEGAGNAADSVPNSKKFEALIGTNAEYAAYVEYGTGKYFPGGRTTPWVYKDPKTGKFYRTSGQPAQPYLRPAFDKNEQRIRVIFKRWVKESIK